MRQIDLSQIREEFLSSIHSAKKIIEEGQETFNEEVPEQGIARETRGLSFVLIFAAYEHMLKGVAKELLEVASTHPGRLIELKQAYIVAGLFGRIESIREISHKKLWNGPAKEIVKSLAENDASCVSIHFFPDDGSYMKDSQVRYFCEYFELPDPASILQRSWQRINTIVRNRNDISHGSSTASEIGRMYTYQDMVEIIDSWSEDWIRFLNAVEEKASPNDFYLR